MTWRIGFDLDNTILEYPSLAHRLASAQQWIPKDCPLAKDAIKKALVTVSGSAFLGEHRWQQIQAWIYGPHIHQARIFDGFIEFVLQMQSAGHHLFIVSHKSKTSHFDTSVDLHKFGRETLEQRGFLKPVDQGGLGFEQIFFEQTRSEKVARIAALDLDFYIDDLSSVLLHKDWPEKTQKIHFSNHTSTELFSCASWFDIAQLFQFFPLLNRLSDRPTSWETLKGGGNNRLFLFRGTEQAVVLKSYHLDKNDPRNRLENEWLYLDVLNKHLPHLAPEPVMRSEQALIQTFIPAIKRHHTEVEPFFEALCQLNKIKKPQKLNKAANARFCLNDFASDLEKRWQQVRSACNGPGVFADAAQFIDQKLSVLKEKAHAAFQQSSYPKDKVLEPQLHYASPSDFGPHNSLTRADGRLVLLDFEYAGWDDPCKLLCDFLHHVGFTMPWSQRLDIVKRFIYFRQEDPSLEERVNAVADMVGLEWFFIVLNVFTKAEKERKLYAANHAGETQLLRERLEKAKLMYDEFCSINDNV